MSWMLNLAGALVIVAAAFFTTLWAIDTFSPSSNTAPTVRASPPPAPAWDERLYLAANPDVAAAIARKEFSSGQDHYEKAGRRERREGGFMPPNWQEKLYLAVNPDVAAAVRQGTFVSGYHHYLAAGRAERREGGMIPENWNEQGYLAANPDVAAAVKQNVFVSGYHHYLVAGRAQKRPAGLQ
jgi:hypothetical protein